MKPDSADLHLERLSAEDAPELQLALGAARQRLPDPQQLTLLAARLSALGLPVKPLAPPAAAPPAATPPWRVWFAAGVIGSGVIALLLWRANAARPKPDASLVPPSTSVALLAPVPSLMQPSRSALSTLGASRAPASAAPTEPEPEQAPRAEPNGAVAAAPQSPPSVPAPSRQAATPSSAVSLTHPTTSERASAVTSAVANRGAVAAPTELALLRDAQLALRTSPAQALGLTEQHQALFPRGAMVQERELIAISALARLGRRSAVLGRAAQFEHDFPSSPYTKQIEALAR